MTLYSISSAGPGLHMKSYAREKCDNPACVFGYSRLLENRMARCHKQMHDCSGVALFKQCDKSIEGPVQSLSKCTSHHVARM